MDITITGRHVNLSPRIQDFIRQKFEKLERYFDRLHGANVVLDQDGNLNRVEFTVGAAKGVVFSSHAESIDLETAINAAEVKIEAQVRRYKDRLTDRRTRHGDHPHDSVPVDLGAEPEDR